MQRPQKRQAGALGLLLAFGCAEPLPAGLPDSPPSPASAAPNSGSALVGRSVAVPVPVSANPAAVPDPVLREYDPAELVPSVPLLGGTLWVTHDDQYAVAAIPASDEVSFVSLASLSHAFSVSTAPGKTPTRLTEDALGRVHVVLRGSHQMATIDPSAAAPVALLHDICVEPRGIAFDALTDEVVVACRSGEVVWFDAASLAEPGAAELRRHFVARDLRDVIATQAGLFVSTFRAAELIELSREGVVLSRTPPHTVSHRELGGTFEPHVAQRMHAGRDASVVLQHQRSNTSPLGLSYTDAVGCGSGATHNTLSVFTPSEQIFQSVGVLPDGPMLDFSVSIDGSAYAALSVGPAGNSLLHQGAVDAGAREPCANPEVNSTELDGLATALTFDGQGQMLVQFADPASLSVNGTRVSLASRSSLPRGLLPFYQPTPAGISCANCHPEGEEDGTTWFRPEGFRRTQPVAGRIATTAPLHWLGDRADFYQVLEDTLLTRMAGSMPALEQVQQLAEFLDSLPLPNAPRSLADSAALRGQTLFVQLKCDACHRGPMFTDNLSHDVGTGDAFQTASLRGVAYRAPFIHNGCAKTLRDRFSDCGGDERHGNWMALSEPELEDLVSYLESL